MNNKRIIFSGGGTGGHVFPAIAIANAVRARIPDVEILFVGAEGRMEMDKVPQAGYEIVGLPVAGFQRRLTAKNLSFPFKLIRSLWKAWSVVGSFKPAVAVGTGGYASGPVLRVAQWRGVPTLVQEQNSYPGVTNRLLAQKAQAVCVSFPGMEEYFESGKIIHTGNPIRSSISENSLSRAEGVAEFGLNPDKPVLFITGGSLGARAINEGIEAGLEGFRNAGIQLIWQTGKTYFEQYRKHNGDGVVVLDFVKRMDAAYAAADAIVSRAGGTIAELCVVGKPAILLPSPHVAEDHQTKNVQSLVDHDAGVLIRDSESIEKLGKTAVELMQDQARMDRLAQNIKALARPNAADDIASAVIRLMQGEAAVQTSPA